MTAYFLHIMPPNKPDEKMSPSAEVLARDIEKVETTVNELRAAVLQIQISSGQIKQMEDSLGRFIERSEIMAERNDKSLTRLHERIDQLNNRVGEEISSMREELRNQHDEHRETVNQQIQTSVLALSTQVATLDQRIAAVKSETEGWINKGKGAWWSASVMWGVFGAALTGAVVWIFGEVRSLHDAMIIIKSATGK